MKKILLSWMLLLMFVISGCSAYETNDEINPQFVIVNHPGRDLYIVKDKQTGIHYYMTITYGGHNVIGSPVYDKNGNIVKSEVE